MRTLLLLLAWPTVVYGVEPTAFDPLGKIVVGSPGTGTLDAGAFLPFSQKTNDGYTGVPAPAGWEWVKVGTEPWKLRKAGGAPGSAGTFQHRDHNCPKCGTVQYVIDSFNRDNTHNHRCPSCGNVWRH